MSSVGCSIPSTAGVILGLGRILSCCGAFAFSKGKLKGDFNPVCLTQCVLSFNNYESFFCASPILGIKNTAVHRGAPHPCAHRVHLGRRGHHRGKAQSKQDVGGQAGLSGGGQGSEGGGVEVVEGGRSRKRRALLFQGRPPSSEDPQIFKGRKTEHILGNWGGDGTPIESSPADTRGTGPQEPSMEGGSLPPVESGPFWVPSVMSPPGYCQKVVYCHRMGSREGSGPIPWAEANPDRR